MAKTDRQTDKSENLTARSTCWEVTAYDENITRLESPSDSWPSWVKEVHGGREVCPKTDRIHFQGCIVTQQVRMSAICGKVTGWLPGCHTEVARIAAALKKYSMKSETAVGEKTVRVQTRQYWPMEVTLARIGEFASEYDRREWNETQRFWFAVKRILRKDPTRTATLANPALLNMWKNTHEVWEDEKTRALVLQPEADGGDASPESEE